jgi:hypothetical protein
MITTKVAFGIDLDDEFREVLAVMPEVPGTRYYMDNAACYAHVGQHAYCSLSGVRARYSQADYDEYKGLLDELRQIGYNVIVVPLSSIEDSKYRDMRVAKLGRI